MNQDTAAYRASGVLETPNAHSMLFKLCKHFAKKIDVMFDEHHGLARFAIGDCELHADTARLSFDCVCDNEGKLASLQEIIDLHVALITRREPRQVAWTRSPRRSNQPSFFTR
jgi:hypothetical protein